MNKKKQLAVLILVCENDAIDQLDLSLFSMIGQVFLPCNVSLIVPEKIAGKVRSLLKYYQFICPKVAWDLKVYQERPETEMTEVMKAFQEVKSYYVAFARPGSILYPNAYTDLIAKLESNPSAVLAFSKTISVVVDKNGKDFYRKHRNKDQDPVVFWDEFYQSCPVHGFLINKDQISPDLKLDEKKITRMSDLLSYIGLGKMKVVDGYNGVIGEQLTQGVSGQIERKELFKEKISLSDQSKLREKVAKKRKSLLDKMIGIYRYGCYRMGL